MPDDSFFFFLSGLKALVKLFGREDGDVTSMVDVRFPSSSMLITALVSMFVGLSAMDTSSSLSDADGEEPRSNPEGFLLQPCDSIRTTASLSSSSPVLLVGASEFLRVSLWRPDGLAVETLYPCFPFSPKAVCWPGAVNAACVSRLSPR